MNPMRLLRPVLRFLLKLVVLACTYKLLFHEKLGSILPIWIRIWIFWASMNLLSVKQMWNATSDVCKRAEQNKCTAYSNSKIDSTGLLKGNVEQMSKTQNNEKNDNNVHNLSSSLSNCSSKPDTAHLCIDNSSSLSLKCINSPVQSAVEFCDFTSEESKSSTSVQSSNSTLQASELKSNESLNWPLGKLNLPYSPCSSNSISSNVHISSSVCATAASIASTSVFHTSPPSSSFPNTYLVLFLILSAFLCYYFQFITLPSSLWTYFNINPTPSIISLFLITTASLLRAPERLFKVFIISIKWNLGLFGATFIFILRSSISIYHFFRIFVDLWLFVALHFATRCYRAFECAANLYNKDPRETILKKLDEAQTYEEWRELCYDLDLLNGGMDWRDSPQSDKYDWEALTSHCSALRSARKNNDILGMVFLLRRCCNRHFCNLTNPELFVKAASGTKLLIGQFQEEVCFSLSYLCTIFEEKTNQLIQFINQNTFHNKSYSSQDTTKPNNSHNNLLDLSNEKKGTTQFSNPSEDNFSHFMASNSPHLSHPSSNMNPIGSNGLDDLISSSNLADSTAHSSLYNQPELIPNDSSNQRLSKDTQTETEIHKESYLNSIIAERVREIQDMRHFMADLRLSMGRTALCLSGGGSLAMYHVGVVRELIEQDIFPRVISGASGGAIVAAMLAIHDDQTLINKILVPKICDQYGKKWFPPLPQQLRNLLSTGFTTRPDEFTQTCQAYFGTLTFGQAYKRTGRLVSIVCSPHNKYNSEALVLNCVNTPDVLLWSAVSASCALPGLVAPTELYAQNAQGEVIPAFPCGFKWMDGSIKLDIPQKELAAYFNVKQFVVSQVNPHCSPFVMTYSAEGKIARSIENWLTLDIKSRYSILAQFNMIPKICGQNISTIWMVQEFEGHVTITPRASLWDWYRMVTQPSQEDMKAFICNGRSRIWPHIERIKHLLKVEKCLQDCWTRLEKKITGLKPLYNSPTSSPMKTFLNRSSYLSSMDRNEEPVKSDKADNNSTYELKEEEKKFSEKPSKKEPMVESKIPSSPCTVSSTSTILLPNNSSSAVEVSFSIKDPSSHKNTQLLDSHSVSLSKEKEFTSKHTYSPPDSHDCDSSVFSCILNKKSISPSSNSDSTNVIPSPLLSFKNDRPKQRVKFDLQENKHNQDTPNYVHRSNTNKSHITAQLSEHKPVCKQETQRSKRRHNTHIKTEKHKPCRTIYSEENPSLYSPKDSLCSQSQSQNLSCAFETGIEQQNSRNYEENDDASQYIKHNMHFDHNKNAKTHKNENNSNTPQKENTLIRKQRYESNLMGKATYPEKNSFKLQHNVKSSNTRYLEYMKNDNIFYPSTRLCERCKMDVACSDMMFKPPSWSELNLAKFASKLQKSLPNINYKPTTQKAPHTLMHSTNINTNTHDTLRRKRRSSTEHIEFTRKTPHEIIAIFDKSLIHKNNF